MLGKIFFGSVYNSASAKLNTRGGAIQLEVALLCSEYVRKIRWHGCDFFSYLVANCIPFVGYHVHLQTRLLRDMGYFINPDRRSIPYGQIEFSFRKKETLKPSVPCPVSILESL